MFGDLGIGEYSRGAIHKTLSLKVRKDNHKNIHSELAISRWLAFTVLVGAVQGVLRTMVPTCQARCAHLHSSHMAIMEVTNISLTGFEVLSSPPY